jgi:hypothetical protein
MQDIIKFFASNPEAVATLLVFAVGGLVSTIALLYSIFADYPIIVCEIEDRGLVSVDSALSENVHVKFTQGTREVEVKELRQMDFEIFNSHPQQQSRDCIVTISLCSPNVSILGVTAANSDNRTPDFGGRKITARIEEVPVQPVNPLLGSKGDQTYPAVVVQIPYLERVQRRDHVFLRITYDGPRLEPKVQGAEPTSRRSYRRKQRQTALIVAVIGLVLTSVLLSIAYDSTGIPLVDTKLWSIPYFIAGLAAYAVTAVWVLVSSYRNWLLSWLRPILNPLIPPPVSPDYLTEFYFYDTTQRPGSNHSD